MKDFQDLLLVDNVWIFIMKNNCNKKVFIINTVELVQHEQETKMRKHLKRVICTLRMVNHFNYFKIFYFFLTIFNILEYLLWIRFACLKSFRTLIHLNILKLPWNRYSTSLMCCMPCSVLVCSTYGSFTRTFKRILLHFTQRCQSAYVWDMF